MRKRLFNKNLPNKKAAVVDNVKSKHRAKKTSNKVPRKRRHVDDDEADKCLYCCEVYSDEGWIRCQVCLKWAHDSCAGVDKRVIKFVCDLCK